MAFSSTRGFCSDFVVVAASRHIVGSDHDMILALAADVVEVLAKSAARQSCHRTSPTQDMLQALARLHTTKPVFAPSLETRLQRQAKLLKTGEAWKNYQRALRQDHGKWQKVQIEKAGQFWNHYGSGPYVTTSSPSSTRTGRTARMTSCRRSSIPSWARAPPSPRT